MAEKPESIVNEEERKRLIGEIGKIKDVLDSFKYGLNFEDFAESLFSTIDRQTVAIKQLDSKMNEIIKQMERLEARFNEGVKVTVSGITSSDSTPQSTEVTMVDDSKKESEAAPESTDIPREKIEAEIGQLKVKIARLFETENELSEMAMNDPAGAEEYNEKARVAREMRTSLEEQLESMERMLK